MAEDFAALSAHPQSVLLCMPELLVMMKAVRHDRPDTWENLYHEEEAADAWYIHLLAGDLTLARRMAAALPRRRFCCFRRGARHGRAHVLPWERLLPTDTEHNR